MSPKSRKREEQQSKGIKLSPGLSPDRIECILLRFPSEQMPPLTRHNKQEGESINRLALGQTLLSKRLHKEGGAFSRNAPLRNPGFRFIESSVRYFKDKS
jgi:hypothetical protein